MGPARWEFVTSTPDTLTIRDVGGPRCLTVTNDADWEGPRVEITVYAPGGRVVWRLRRKWNLTALATADSEIRHVVGLAVRSGRAPQLGA